MKDKFAYYDFIANIIPGIICLWLLQFFGIMILDQKNIVAESILYIVVAYVIGLAIQFFAKYIIELIAKVIFWENLFFSDICLLKGANRISENLRTTILKIARDKFDINEDSINALNENFVFGFKGRIKFFDKKYRMKVQKAHKISNLIYRRIDAYTKDNNLGLKAHEQNNYYSLFRGLSMVFLTFLCLSMCVILLKHNLNLRMIYLLTGTAVGFIIFLIRARERGEHYVKGLLYSIPYEKSGS